jgi:tRNA(fMet)-specific endonuclease VapC
MRYLLDTNIISALEKAPQGPLLSRITAVGIDNVVTSLIVAGELRFGMEKSMSDLQRGNLETLVGMIAVLPLEPPVDREYGRIRADLERQGTPIGANDLWIAAHALALGLTLVTDNVSEFSRVKGLRVENWLRA